MTDEITLDTEVVDSSVMELPPLNRMHDRCDRCGAEAYVRAVVPGGGEVLLCGHHATMHWTALCKQAVQIQDEREKINTTPSPSANV
jgi:hypothetical protein